MQQRRPGEPRCKHRNWCEWTLPRRNRRGTWEHFVIKWCADCGAITVTGQGWTFPGDVERARARFTSEAPASDDHKLRHSRATRAGQREALERGSVIGRPRFLIPKAILQEVKDGRTTIKAVARTYGISPLTVRRRVAELVVLLAVFWLPGCGGDEVDDCRPAGVWEVTVIPGAGDCSPDGVGSNEVLELDQVGDQVAGAWWGELGELEHLEPEGFDPERCRVSFVSQGKGDQVGALLLEISGDLASGSADYEIPGECSQERSILGERVE